MAIYTLRPKELHNGMIIEIINDKGKTACGEMEVFDLSWIMNKSRMKRRKNLAGLQSSIALEKARLFSQMETDLECIRTGYGEEMVQAIREIFSYKIEAAYDQLDSK